MLRYLVHLCNDFMPLYTVIGIVTSHSISICLLHVHETCIAECTQGNYNTKNTMDTHKTFMVIFTVRVEGFYVLPTGISSPVDRRSPTSSSAPVDE